MATLKRLVTFPEITARTVVALGSEAHKFTVAIPLAEQQHLRPVLGQALYSELLSFIQTATPDDADPLSALAEQVKDMLSTWAVVEAWPSLLGHIEAAGFVTKVGKSEGTTRADVELTDRQEAALRRTAILQSAELVRWLTEHKSEYPSWEAPGGPPSTEMALGGLLL
ncbi:hypothetical protein Q5H92_08980 [Hymenobacter sp. M29]|uniref:Uncharacterized protein n=1 Tax=Hymenobacter mellowenesis TaxID=3063995 RepID=A0ABT9A9G8_9BACT|nr:hypothetical protein [Hymenobacter sp. M29]MDO7846489.1 hypothetical protein [Hymenobacter sp. M29]